MNQRKKDIMKIRIIQAYAVCKAFLDAYRNEENLKSLEEFGDVVDEISAFVDAFDNSPLFQTLKDIRQIAYEKYQHDWMISHDIDEKVMDKTMQEYIADTAGEEVPFSEWFFPLRINTNIHNRKRLGVTGLFSFGLNYILSLKILYRKEWRYLNMG